MKETTKHFAYYLDGKFCGYNEITGGGNIAKRAKKRHWHPVDGRRFTFGRTRVVKSD